MKYKKCKIIKKEKPNKTEINSESVFSIEKLVWAPEFRIFFRSHGPHC